MAYRRVKISHDPNNLAWSTSTESSSFGRKILSEQGWRPGEGLGAREARDSRRLASSKVDVKVVYKDDTLGLGARLKSRDVCEHARTGLDAFQGLLGRLNGKSEEEVESQVRKSEERKLAVWAQGRWGGLVFVPGGKLVMGDGYKRLRAVEEGGKEAGSLLGERERMSTADEKGLTRREKTRKEDSVKAKLKASGKGKRRLDKSIDASRNQVLPKRKLKTVRQGVQGSHAGSSARGVSSDQQQEPSKTSTPPLETPTDGVITARVTQAGPRNGRHMIRGRNIQAKKMAFADAKMLDEVYLSLPVTRLRADPIQLFMRTP